MSKLDEQNSIRGLKHSTLAALVNAPEQLATIHSVSEPEVLAAEKAKKDEAPVVEKPASHEPPEERGRFLIFLPTNERVTISRVVVGQTYAGLHVHEVITKDGRKFLASSKQLRKLVK